jgi:hypothetical protein
MPETFPIEQTQAIDVLVRSIMLHRNTLTLENDTVIRPTLSLNLCIEKFRS